MQSPEVNREWRKRNPEACRAHTILDWEIRCGRVVPQPCEVCGEPKTHGHHDDYSKPLEVRWLCSHHHRKLHWPEDPKARQAHQAPWENRKVYMPAPKRDALLPEAQKLRAEGKSYGQIGQSLGVGKGQVYKWLNPKGYK